MTHRLHSDLSFVNTISTLFKSRTPETLEDNFRFKTELKFLPSLTHDGEM